MWNIQAVTIPGVFNLEEEAREALKNNKESIWINELKGLEKYPISKDGGMGRIKMQYGIPSGIWYIISKNKFYHLLNSAIDIKIVIEAEEKEKKYGKDSKEYEKAVKKINNATEKAKNQYSTAKWKELCYKWDHEGVTEGANMFLKLIAEKKK